MTHKAIVTQIEYAGLSFEGLMLPDGEYRIAVSQIATMFQFDKNQASRSIKAILGKDFQFDKVVSELNSKKVNSLDLSLLSIVATVLMTRGNELATRFVLASVNEKLERIFDNAFGIVVEEREREQRFAARLMTKATFRPLTDELKRHGFTEGWQYGKYVKAFQDALGFECGTRDVLDLQTLLMLGNCQSELKCLMRAGYAPWDALELWIEQQV